MSLTNNTSSSQAQSQTRPSCPYIGILNDPQTRVGIPDTRNCCHLVNPPSFIDLSHQESYCLSKNFPGCPIYQTSGEGPIPAGILGVDSNTEKSFKFGIFGLKRSSSKEQKTTTPPDEKKEEIWIEQPDPVAAAAIAAGASGAAIDDGEQLLSTSEASIPDDDDELRMRLYNEALNHYEQAKNVKKEKRGLWAFLLIIALAVLLISTWGVYSRLQNLQRQALLNAEINYTISLATAVQDMSAAAAAWGTAAAVVEQEQQTATAIARQTEIARQTVVALSPDQITATAAVLAVTPTPSLAICSDISQAAYEVVSGPILNPPVGTFYRSGLQNPQASWIVKNTGTCGWSQVYLWSVFDNLVLQPIVKRNGEVIDLAAQDGTIVVSPGEQIDVSLEFPLSVAQNVEGEWVLVVDGLSLFTQPKLVLDTFNWIIVAQIERPTATRTSRPSGGPAPTSSGPPSREDPTPEPRVTP